jgi:hypothetical protein
MRALGMRGLVIIGLLSAALAAGCSSSDSTSDADYGTAANLPLPSTVSRSEYQQRLYRFLGDLTYRRLGWRRDKAVRDSGPYRDGNYYGTHPAVRIYYSPEVMRWLAGGRAGEIPDGGLIIKEMYDPPAERYAHVRERDLPTPTWTVMTKDRAGSVDGWFWTYFDTTPEHHDPPVPQAVDGHEFPFRYPDSDFGSYCVRCHASAESAMTFITTENIEGFEGEPMEYAVDDSWIDDPDGPGPDPLPNQPTQSATPSAHDFINRAWVDLYDQQPLVDRHAVTALPPVSRDRVVANGHTEFVTSDQCESCHSGDASPFGPNLLIDGVDVSPFAEWRWSMMGLAGRDPIFYAQLESEVALHGGAAGALSASRIEGLCLHCHGVMGQRQHASDHPEQDFTVAKALAHADDDPMRDYGGLARDGVSCLSCHRIKDDADLSLTQIQNGDFRVDAPLDGALTVYGPFKNPSEFAMLGALAAKPVEGPHMRSSRICASCHTVFLPVLDERGQVIDAKYEQATFLEWLNSSFRDDGLTPQSCQDCHMLGGFGREPALTVKIANIQDQDFPPTSFLAPLPNITVEPREGYRRHTLLGINVFGMEMFRQFPDLLGVRLRSFMTGLENGLPQAINNATAGAAIYSARVEILDAQRAGEQVTARVKVTNLVGHRLPSGVGFRRMVLQLLVVDRDGAVVWGSGRINPLGVVVDEHDVPLPSEFHEIDPQSGQQAYEPHYETVTSQRQAQIYEELLRDSRGQFTTSFLARAEDVKDNRLLPTGWTAAGPEGFEPEFAEATEPHGGAAHDADFIDGSGSDTITYVAQIPGAGAGPLEVRAALYYQSIPPRYLNDRFNQAQGPAGQRLHYLTSHLDDSKTSFPGWKLPLGSDVATLP